MIRIFHLQIVLVVMKQGHITTDDLELPVLYLGQNDMIQTMASGEAVYLHPKPAIANAIAPKAKIRKEEVTPVKVSTKKSMHINDYRYMHHLNQKRRLSKVTRRILKKRERVKEENLVSKH